MSLPRLYSPENVERSRYALIAAAALTVLVCGYLAVSTLLQAREAWHAQRLLRDQRQTAMKLSRRVALDTKREHSQPAPSDGGVELFALRLSRWARSGGVQVDSLTPEGVPAATELKVGETRLGIWNTYKVRVKGSATFPGLIALLDEFRDPGMPVRLESIALASSGDDENGIVDFDLTVTVYEKKSGAA